MNKDLQECLNAPILFQCNEKIINLLTELKLNGLTRNLFEANKSSTDPFFANSAFMGLHKNFNEFASFYEMLSIAAMQKPIGSLRELSPAEKKDYLLEIDTIKKQIPSNHNGRIYKGNIRIQ